MFQDWVQIVDQGFMRKDYSTQGAPILGEYDYINDIRIFFEALDHVLQCLFASH